MADDGHEVALLPWTRIERVPGARVRGRASGAQRIRQRSRRPEQRGRNRTRRDKRRREAAFVELVDPGSADIAKKAFNRVAHKLPVKVRMVTKRAI